MLASPLLLQGSEWLIVVVIIGALLVFGPDKIPQLARTVGKAMAEFNKASNEARTMMDTAMKSIDAQTSAVATSVNSAVSDVKSSVGSTANEMLASFSTSPASASQGASPSPAGEPASTPSPSSPATEVDADALLKLAHRMGIVTDGKTRDEISEEIFSKTGGMQAKPS